jgi:hypothetical protein
LMMHCEMHTPSDDVAGGYSGGAARSSASCHNEIL